MNTNDRKGECYESKIVRPLSLDVCNLQASIPRVDGIVLEDITGGSASNGGEVNH